MSIQRINDADQKNVRQAVINFGCLPFFLSLPIFVIVYLMQRSSSLYTDTICKLDNFQVLLVILVALVQIELLAEPFAALNQFAVNLKAKSKAEGLAVFVKCVATVALIILIQKKSLSHVSHVFAFAVGHLAYALTIFVVYWSSSVTSFPIPKKLKDGRLLDRSTVPIWRSLSLQMIFKHLLTEGDTLLVSYLFTVSQQGVYSLISNYGSLLARLLFQPIEETLRVSMTKIISSKNADLKQSYEFMSTMTVFYTNLCVLVLLGGYTNGSFMLRCVLGNSANWLGSDIYSMFPFYILYIPFMAFNGIFEAFLSSASTHKGIGRFSVFMSILSIIVLTILYVLIGKLHMGILGLIISNIINMTMRILYCLVFMSNFFKSKVGVKAGPLIRRLSNPVGLALSAFAAQYLILGHLMTETPREFIVSLAMCFVCLLGCVWNERGLLLSIFNKKTKSD